MKFLLTSGGISNKTIENAFKDLLGKPFSESKVAFIPTASNVEAGDKWWLIKDLRYLQDAGFAQIDIVDVSAMPLDSAKARLAEADALFFEGGNTFHLAYWLKKLDLKPYLEELLQTRLWVGVSAGSKVAGMGLADSSDRSLVESFGEVVDNTGLGFVNFSLEPHYSSKLFNDRDDESVTKKAEQFREPFFVIDDDTAISVVDGNMEIISEGKWKKFN